MKAVLGVGRRMLGFVLVLPLAMVLVLVVQVGVGVVVGLVAPGRRLVISVTSFVLMLVLDILGCIGSQ
jgi:uncharacterized membrane protein YqjE